MFFWTEDSIEWYRAAAQAGTFHADLAQILLSKIEKDESVCELGCGLGYLAAELAKGCHSVLAVDTDARALAVLRERQIENVTILCGDAHALPPDVQCDTMVLCFFGRLTENDNFDRYFAHCTRRLIAIVNSSTQSVISPTGKSRPEKERSPQIAAFLQARNVPFHLQETTLSFGQPFKTQTEAQAFMRHYDKNSTEEQIKAHAKADLLKTDDGYYLPYQKKIGIFTVEK